MDLYQNLMRPNQAMNDIGNLCTHCHRDTSIGSGLFVNRIPSGTDNEDGYMCPGCQSIECDKCNEKHLDWENVDGEILCWKCISWPNTLKVLPRKEAIE